MCLEVFDVNKEWSELNRTMQVQIKKKETFDLGISTLLMLRKILMEQIFEFKDTLRRDEFDAIPFMNADGYHSKTIAYSLFHIFRIEDIVANTLIKKDIQIFFENNYQNSMNSPIITTGNELVMQEIAEFSSKLNIAELYQYIVDVDCATTKLLKQLTYQDMKTKMTEEDKQMLHSLRIVSEDETAVWLIDYWCSKNVRGLLQMPFSRHWIMHIEACLRIKNKIHVD